MSRPRETDLRKVAIGLDGVLIHPSKSGIFLRPGYETFLQTLNAADYQLGLFTRTDKSRVREFLSTSGSKYLFQMGIYHAQNMPKHRLSKVTGRDDPQGKFESETDEGRHGGLDPTLIHAASLVDININYEAAQYFGFLSITVPIYLDLEDTSLTWAKTAIENIVAYTT